MIILPNELQQLLDQNKARAISLGNRRGAQGLMVHVLNDYAGDDLRRRTFLKAAFGVESSHDLTNWQIAAFLAYKDHPQAKSEINRVIADYLKTQGQMELL